MDDIRRRDRQLFVKQLFTFWRVSLYVIVSMIGIGMAVNNGDPGWLVPWILAIGASTYVAYQQSKEKRFRDKKYAVLWAACKDRLNRLEDALRSLKKAGIAELEELPRTVFGVAESLYYALRRADNVMYEVTVSEGAVRMPPPRLGPPSADAQAMELYRIADRNIAEYRHHFDVVVSGAHRTEAQAAVFTTTLDNLRLKVLSYRLTGNRAELPTSDFLQAMTEARMQLDAIDKALDELELTPFPTTVAVMPDELDPRQQMGRTSPPTPPEESDPRENVIRTSPPPPPDPSRHQQENR